MVEVLDRITNKVGPLPAWAWAAIPASAYVAYSYIKASREPTVIDPTVDGGAEGTDAEDYGLNTGGAFLPGYGAAPSGSSNAVPPVEMPKFDNQSWFRQALNWLISEGVISTDAVTALNAYIYGTPQTVTSTQLQALQRAIARFGGAPDPAFVPTATAPTTPPKPAPAPTITKPSAPTNVQARMHSINTKLALTTAIVSWGLPVKNGGAPIIGFQIEQWQRTGSTWKRVHIKQAGATARSIIFPVKRGEWNTFRVYAINKVGMGPHAYQSLRIP